jgi:hypothetical protein
MKQVGEAKYEIQESGDTSRTRRIQFARPFEHLFDQSCGKKNKQTTKRFPSVEPHLIPIIATLVLKVLIRTNSLKQTILIEGTKYHHESTLARQIDAFKCTTRN